MYFEVEQVLPVHGQALVFARQIGHVDFALGESPCLGGLRIHPVITAPRALDASGKQRLDFFTFRLIDKADLSRISRGDVVELSDGDAR